MQQWVVLKEKWPSTWRMNMVTFKCFSFCVLVQPFVYKKMHFINFCTSLFFSNVCFFSADIIEMCYKFFKVTLLYHFTDLYFIWIYLGLYMLLYFLMYTRNLFFWCTHDLKFLQFSKCVRFKICILFIFIVLKGYFALYFNRVMRHCHTEWHTVINNSFLIY